MEANTHVEPFCHVVDFACEFRIGFQEQNDRVIVMVVM